LNRLLRWLHTLESA